MGQVMPMRRRASVAQCEQVTILEELAVAQVTLWSAWLRVVTRIWWRA